MTKKSLFLLAGITFLVAHGCSTQHKVEVAPVEVKPIHITIDVNVKVDKALDDFFSDVDNANENVEPKSTATE
jgi:Skp family chaperone for outer membrane proteins